MKAVKLIVLATVIAIVAYGGWNYFAGPLKDRRDIRALGASIASCTPYTQTVRRGPDGERLTNDVEGRTDDGRCKLQLQTAGHQKIYCALPLAKTEAVGEAYADFASTIGIFGNVTISYNSDDQDAWNDAMNSPACEIR